MLRCRISNLVYDRLGSFTWFVRVMSVHPPIAAAKRTWRHFSFVPGSDICAVANSTLFDHLVGEGEQIVRQIET